MEPSWRSKPLVIYLARFFWIHSKTLHVALSFVLKVVWKLLRATHHVEILAYSWRCIKRWIVRIVCRRPVNRDKLVSFCLCFFFCFPCPMASEIVPIVLWDSLWFFASLPDGRKGKWRRAYVCHVLTCDSWSIKGPVWRKRSNSSKAGMCVVLATCQKGKNAAAGLTSIFRSRCYFAPHCSALHCWGHPTKQKFSQRIPRQNPKMKEK